MKIVKICLFLIFNCIFELIQITIEILMNYLSTILQKGSAKPILANKNLKIDNRYSINLRKRFRIDFFLFVFNDN